MKKQSLRVRLMKVTMAVAVGGSTFAVTGCDPTVRSTIVSGLETSAQSITSSFISSFFLSLGDGDENGSGLTTTSP